MCWKYWMGTETKLPWSSLLGEKAENLHSPCALRASLYIVWTELREGKPKEAQCLEGSAWGAGTVTNYPWHHLFPSCEVVSCRGSWSVKDLTTAIEILCDPSSGHTRREAAVFTPSAFLRSQVNQSTTQSCLKRGFGFPCCQSGTFHEYLNPPKVQIRVLVFFFKDLAIIHMNIYQ